MSQSCEAQLKSVFGIVVSVRSILLQNTIYQSETGWDRNLHTVSPAEVEFVLFRGGQEPLIITSSFRVNGDDAGRQVIRQTPFLGSKS